MIYLHAGMKSSLKLATWMPHDISPNFSGTKHLPNLRKNIFFAIDMTSVFQAHPPLTKPLSSAAIGLFFCFGMRNHGTFGEATGINFQPAWGTNDIQYHTNSPNPNFVFLALLESVIPILKPNFIPWGKTAMKCHMNKWHVDSTSTWWKDRQQTQRLWTDGPSRTDQV